MLRTSRACLLIASFAATALSSRLAAQDADLILVGGTFLTQDPTQPTAVAIAVRNDSIVAVGRETEVRRLGGSSARIVDLRGKTVIPGLIDGHVHLEWR